MIEEEPVKRADDPRLNPKDSGISVQDAQAIKTYLLECAKAGCFDVGEAFSWAEDITSAFRLIDDEVFRRDKFTERARQLAARIAEKKERKAMRTRRNALEPTGS